MQDDTTYPGSSELFNSGLDGINDGGASGGPAESAPPFGRGAVAGSPTDIGGTIREKLDRARRDLLDLTCRNHLVNTPRQTSRHGRLEIVDELSEEVFRHLVPEGKAMSFLPASNVERAGADGDPSVEAGGLAQPEDDEEESGGLAARHTDDRLQTALSSEQLQRKLLKLQREARTFEEEQGVNILYLTLGFLKWYEADSSDRERYAPLLLIPVALDRRSATSRFKLRYIDDDVTTNLSLQEKLQAEFGLTLPDVPDVEDLSPNDYFADVAEVIAGYPRWEVLGNDIVMWFFSFSKFLMYRDLDPGTWPEGKSLDAHPLMDPLLRGSFRNEPPVCGDDESIDRVLQPADTVHVMDADSSQALAIEEVRRGRNLVIQGPPGTGKSQTITNLIAAAVQGGKTVLFVAEKMAALEVVKQRLDNIELGDMCLELHSRKANKRAVLEDLGRTLRLGAPKVGDLEGQAQQLRASRDRLNQHAEVMHGYLQPAGVTPYAVLGELVRLRALGIEPPDFRLRDPLTWTDAQFRERVNMLGDLALHMQELGDPTVHPWRGVELDTVLPTDVDRITASIPGILSRIGRLSAAIRKLTALLRVPPGATAREATALIQLAQQLATAPPMDRKSFGDNVWQERREEIDTLVADGMTLAHCREKLDGTVAEVAWSTDVADTRRRLASHGRSWFRIFSSAYRSAQAELRGILVGPPPRSIRKRLEILDSLIRGRQVVKSLDRSRGDGQLGRHAFGRLWRDADSDWSALGAITHWEAESREADVAPTFHETLAGLDDVTATSELAGSIAGELEALQGEISTLFASLKLDIKRALGVSDPEAVPLARLGAHLEAWQADPESISRWIAYQLRWRKLEAEGLGKLASGLDSGTIEPESASNRICMAYYEELMREVFHRNRCLAEFDGSSHEQVLEQFRALDVQRLALARQEVALAHYRNIPNGGSDIGEVALVKREINKKRRHLPLRKLLNQAGKAIQAIKPVFMMSPLSIAQYLKPGDVEFDLLVIDEASQVQPVDALGAIGRAGQIVVVGDDRQLPPSRFFSKVLVDGDRDDDFQAGDMDSILGLCVAQNMPQRMLRWHYRSRHHSLIAVSNHEFYGDHLFVVPSPVSKGGSLGLSFRHVRDGVYDRGGSRTNRVEARAVADAIIEHARTCPQWTLGVGTFSVAQRDAIIDELELRRRECKDVESFFSESGAEPFFVKNLENIQGDERDVIFISVGYGKDSSGYMAMNFGPLGSEGGHRRLNVLITRARCRCEVFSSITQDDIDLARAQSRGVASLRTFLEYARSGCLDVGQPTGRDFDSEFEREVARALQSLGYQVHAQVGVAGFFIDLAVVDPELPGRYLLGIECDGAAYHSARSARDRDRLRQQVLEDRGWIIHRIWSTDWFHCPDQQLRKTLSAIEQAKVEWAKRDPETPAEGARPATSLRQKGIERFDADQRQDQGRQTIETTLYVEATVDLVALQQADEVTIDDLAEIVTQIVEIEGPVHRNEVTRRVTAILGFKRTGKRIAEAVTAAFQRAESQDRILPNGPFYASPQQNLIKARNRSDVDSPGLRKPERLPPEEIRSAILAVVATHLGVNGDEAVVESSRLFGFKSTSAQLRQAISQQVDDLLDQGLLENRNGRLYARSVGPTTIG